MKKHLKSLYMFLCLLIIGTFTVACGGGGGGSSSGGGYGYIPAVPNANPTVNPTPDPTPTVNPTVNPTPNPNPTVNPINPNYKNVTLNDQVLRQLFEIGLIKINNKDDFDKNELTEIDIPATYTYDGSKYQITAIADKLFYNCVNLKKVTIPNTVTKIGDFSFWNVDHIYYNTNIPYNRYGWGALNVNNDKYKEVDLFYSDNSTNQPALNHLIELGNYIPQNQLATIHIPAIYIYDRTKYKIVSIHKQPNGSNYISTNFGYKSITPQYLHIPASVNYIGGIYANGAFMSCSTLEGIDIPDSVNYIGQYCFYDCNALKSINIPNKVKTIQASTFWRCSSLKKVTIPNSVTKIEGSAFWNCISLKNIEIPDSVTTIDAPLYNDYGVFGDCTQLESVKLSSNLQNLNEKIFHNCTALKSINIPKSVITIGDYVFWGCTSLKSAKIEEGSKLTSIGNGSFYDCPALESINIPNSVTQIGGNTFYNCTSLIVEIPDSVVNIASYAFYNVPHIYYTGIATGAPWGAKAIN